MANDSPTTRLYENSGHSWRMTLSTVVLILAILYGFFEIWLAARHDASGTSSGSLIGFGFIAAGAWGFRTIVFKALDSVVYLDADRTTGDASLALWRPFRPKIIPGPLDLLSGWRLDVRTAKRTRTYFLMARHRDHRHPIEFELSRDLKYEGLKPLAAEEIEEFENQAPR